MIICNAAADTRTGVAQAPGLRETRLEQRRDLKGHKMLQLGREQRCLNLNLRSLCSEEQAVGFEQIVPEPFVRGARVEQHDNFTVLADGSISAGKAEGCLWCSARHCNAAAHAALRELRAAEARRLRQRRPPPLCDAHTAEPAHATRTRVCVAVQPQQRRKLFDVGLKIRHADERGGFVCAEHLLAYELNQRRHLRAA